MPKEEPVEEPVIEPEEPATVSVKVKKVWMDSNDQDGNRPEYITVTLTANGKNYATVKISAADGWAYEFKDLAQYDENGKAVEYGIMEEPVEKASSIST